MLLGRFLQAGKCDLKAFTEWAKKKPSASQDGCVFDELGWLFEELMIIRCNVSCI